MTVPLLIMDTAPAAVLGALDDPLVAAQADLLVANVGNFHRLAFHIAWRADRRLLRAPHRRAGAAAARKGLLERLGDGTLTNAEVFNSMGHGALIVQDLPRFPPAPGGHRADGGRCCAARGSTPTSRCRTGI